MTTPARLAVLQHNRDSRSQARAERITRTLRLVERCHGQLTTRIVIRLTGWTQRSAERYLNALWADGLVHREYRAEYHSHRWSVTEVGRAQLTGARAA